MAETTDVFESARTNLLRAKLALHAAVQEHDDARLACAEALAAIANACYASPEVTPDKLARLGLSLRSTSHARHAPHKPQRLNAEPTVVGDVILDWERGENADRMIYIVETLKGGTWTFAATTQRTRLKLSGFPPGGETSFRVVATKDGARSTPSNVATIYALSPLRAA